METLSTFNTYRTRSLTSLKSLNDCLREMLKFQSDLVNPTLFTATPPGAGRSLDVAKVLFEDSHAAIIPILPNTITCTYTQGQTEWTSQTKTEQVTLLYVQALEWEITSTGGLPRHKHKCQQQV